MPDIKVKITREENAERFGCLVGDTVTVDFEVYVAAVVGSEIGNRHIEACKAQAIASRTYAVKRGVLSGKAISDSSATAQAFRIRRYDPDNYPKCIEAANATAGMILTYKGKAIDAVYSGNNGGILVSSSERWGNVCPYLVAKEDPWDAADGRDKYGHGVGMSQRGAVWAAEHGVGYQEILQFYYPGTALVSDYGEVETVNEKAETIIRLAKERLGCPYVFGALGQIRNGVQVFDCRGFTWWLLKQVGISISTVGATTQYNTTRDWTERGLTKDIPNLVCPVFKYRASDGRMSHTGMHIGNGQVIHCTSNGGVKYGSLTDSSWTHYAIPRGMYTAEEIKNARGNKTMRTLKVGSSGADVMELQQMLADLGYECGIADGIFGTKTKLAVAAFQEANGLTADGIVGVNTWAALQRMASPTENPVDEDDEAIASEGTVPLSEALAYQLYQELKAHFEGDGSDA